MNTKIAKIIDHPDLIRDLESKAVLATDIKKYSEHVQKKNLLKDMMKQNEEIKSLKKDIEDLKALVGQLVNNK